MRVRAALVAMASAALVALSSVPAAADEGSILISHDGVNFVASSDLALFSDAGRVVPGDEVTDTVWIKNNTAVTAKVRIDLTEVSANDSDLAEATWIVIDSARVGVSVQSSIDQGACTVLSNDLVLAPGQAAPIDARMAVDAELGSRPGDVGDEGQNGSVSFQIRALLADAAVDMPGVPGEACVGFSQPTPVPTVSPTQPPAELPATGSAVPAPATLGLMAAGMIGGALLLWRGRKERETHE